MADYKEGQGAKTHRDNDFKGKIVDGQSGAVATDILTVAQPTDTVVADTNDYGIPVLFKDESGNYCIPETDDNCHLKVVIVDEDDDDKKHSYLEHTAIASAATSDDDTVITSGQTVSSVKITASSGGCFKYEIGEYDGVSAFDVRATLFSQPASPTVCCEVCIPPIVGDGTLALRIRVTNMDDTANNAYTALCWTEKA